MYNLSVDEISMVDGGGDGGSSNKNYSGYPAKNGSYNKPSQGSLSPSCVGGALAGFLGGVMTGGLLGGAVGLNGGAYAGGCYNGNGGY
ncbi:hypothetical protein J4N45_06825 [Vibrio sp. SCSIO 43140]|uniref:hypothetical protein n=1 Tax=Vibrio TaxID=662 RepID=UPI002074DF05|nr:hypothetical protein [Vibrio sp. SCSIO 43140]USD61668.1 hypothetical protein J4N45_06825 [Vibrio sp. SCSIO 43140]